MVLSFVSGGVSLSKEHRQSAKETIKGLMQGVRTTMFDTFESNHPSFIIVDDNNPQRMKANDRRECAFDIFEEFCKGKFGGASQAEIVLRLYDDLDAKGCPEDILAELRKSQPGFDRNPYPMEEIKRYADQVLAQAGVPVDFDEPPETWMCWANSGLTSASIDRKLNPKGKFLTQQRDPSGTLAFYDQGPDSLKIVQNFVRGRKDFQRRQAR
jgi:hypothetical protein